MSVVTVWEDEPQALVKLRVMRVEHGGFAHYVGSYVGFGGESQGTEECETLDEAREAVLAVYRRAASVPIDDPFTAD